MNDETRYDKLEDSFHKERMEDKENHDYHEETAAEVAAPVSFNRDRENDVSEDKDHEHAHVSGKVIGWSALALSVLSLFFLPIVLGAAGTILGFVARRRGARALGAWSIGIGVVSLILGIFVQPFF
ncbi:MULTISPECIES: DUF4190 domain-containing protein [Heyndrickxia]|uniref:DUF4190 domain-containing protein n=1 Tax=Heyndrickxia TaxID=2837504 RepID=UPI001B037895|nr:DUF4190 domain-containing protein [Heyndrickxia oleronia]GIN38517.1 hypothetical protein J19TS1_14660 [Heyndrickxia oleronia]